MELSRRGLLRAVGLSAAAVAGSSVLAACGSSGAAPSGGTGSAGKSLTPWPSYIPATGPTPDLAATAQGVQAAYLKYPEKIVNLGLDKPGDGSVVKVVMLTYGTPAVPLEQNTYWQAINDALGIKIDLTLIPNADFPSKMATIMASGDLPDIIHIGGGHSLPREAEFVSSQCADLSEYVTGDAIKTYPYLANIPTYAWKGMGRIGGKLFGIPVERPLFSDVLIANKEMFAGAGQTPGWSVDQFETVMKALATEKKYGLGSNQLKVFGYKVHGSWHGAPNMWKVDAGKFSSTWETAEFKAALEFMTRMRKAGVYNPDVMSLTPADGTPLFLNQKVGSQTDGIGGIFGTVAKIQGAFTQDLVEPYKPATGQATPWAGRGIFGYTVLKKAAPERIKMLLRVLNHMAAPFGTKEYELIHYGVEGAHFTRDEAGAPVGTELAGKEKTIPFSLMADAPQVLYFPAQPGAPKEAFEAATKMMHAYQAKIAPTLAAGPHYGLLSDAAGRNGVQMEKIIQDGIAAIVTGRAGQDSWDGVVTKWKSAGGDQAAAELAKEYAANA
ncbi:hypothetical protein ABZV14_44535 [Streptosporangium canum]|uniref:hypothetical protein n=1 Tax=Streptosporangium canum TaxID=324952 RepID=UPI0033A561B6